MFDHLKGMLDHTVVGAYTASMHDRNDRGVKGIEHDGQTVSDQHTQRHLRELRYQGISLDALQTAPQHGCIDDTHMVAVHLAYGT
jgi:hypothetical protein